MENGSTSKRAPENGAENGATSEEKKKYRWTCQWNNCTKRAQTRCNAMCKAHYKEFQLSQRNNNTEQGAADPASFSESAQQAVAREEPCIQEHKSAQRAVAREEPGV